MAARVVRKSASIETNAYVPDKAIGDTYKGRKLPGGVWDFDLAEIATYQAANVLLMGDTGSGKTLFGMAFAAKTRRHYYSLPCDVSIDPSAIFGKMVPTEEAGKFRWQDGPATQIVRHGGILNLSEVNMMLPKIAASLYPLLDHRRYIPLLANNGEIVRAHRCDEECAPRGIACPKALLIIADMNPNYRGTQKLNAAFANRFKYKVDWGYNGDVEDKLIVSSTVREIASQLRVATNVVLTPVSTNMLIDFEQTAQDDELGLDFAIANFVASFDPSERAAVEEVIKLNRDNLEKDMAFVLGGSDSDSGEDEEWEFDDEGAFQ